MIRDTSAQDRPVASPRRGRRWWWLSIPMGLVVAGILVPGVPRLARMMSTEASVSAARLAVATVEWGPLTRDVAGEGKVVAAVSPTLYAGFGGTVSLAVQAGDGVKRGQVLARIESPDLMAKLGQERSNADALRSEFLRAQVDARQQRAQLQSQLETAAIAHKTAQNDLARQTKAFEAGAASGMQVDLARDTLEKAAVALKHAQAGLTLKDDAVKFELQAKEQAWQRQQLVVKDLERQVTELTVRSPVDGQVGQLFVSERATVAKDAKLLTVVDLSALEVQMQVAESFARDLAIGMPGEIQGNGQTWRGLISAISPEVVNNEVAARLRFADQRPEQLRQNQRLSVRVLLDHRDRVLTVARGSFIEDLAGQHAYVLRDGQAEKRAIRLGARSLDKVEVRSGLQPGDRVVIAGTEHFKGAERVTISQ